MKENQRTGWGQNRTATVFYENIENFTLPKGINDSTGLAVGLGRSYGDSSLNEEGTLWRTLALNELSISKDLSEATCGSGVTIGELERSAVKHGLFPPVVPGTEFVTIGGAIASDIHGKSHHTFGSFGHSVLEIRILDSSGKILTLKPTDCSREFFWATIGGMGLTGAILSARIRLVPIANTYVSVREERVRNLREMLEKLSEFDSTHLYTVAWIDLSGRFEGRGTVSGGTHAQPHELEREGFDSNYVSKPFSSRTLPSLPRVNYINNLSVRTFNEVWYRKPLKNGFMHYRPFLHPLDHIADWNKIHGPKGFLQYQFVIPFGSEDFIEFVLRELRRANVSSFLGVLKKFGPLSSGYLSFPISGWTLAIDLPEGNSEVPKMLGKFDERLSQSGGRVYLTKDSRLESKHLPYMYPELESWIGIKREIDPKNYWQSLQGKRLGLC